MEVLRLGVRFLTGMACPPVASQPGRAASGIRRGVNIEVEFPQQPGEGDPRVSLDGHGRVRADIASVVSENWLILRDSLPRLLASVPSGAREFQQAEMVRLKTEISDRFPPPSFHRLRNV
jgi:hypothetical protein